MLLRTILNNEDNNKNEDGKSPPVVKASLKSALKSIHKSHLVSELMMRGTIQYFQPIVEHDKHHITDVTPWANFKNINVLSEEFFVIWVKDTGVIKQTLNEIREDPNYKKKNRCQKLLVNKIFD